MNPCTRDCHHSLHAYPSPSKGKGTPFALPLALRLVTTSKPCEEGRLVAVWGRTHMAQGTLSPFDSDCGVSACVLQVLQ